MPLGYDKESAVCLVLTAYSSRAPASGQSSMGRKQVQQGTARMQHSLQNTTHCTLPLHVRCSRALRASSPFEMLDVVS